MSITGRLAWDTLAASSELLMFASSRLCRNRGGDSLVAIACCSHDPEALRHDLTTIARPVTIPHAQRFGKRFGGCLNSGQPRFQPNRSFEMRGNSRVTLALATASGPGLPQRIQHR